MNISKDIAPVILSAVHIGPKLQQRAGIYFNRNEDGYNLFAEQLGGQEQAYLFNMYGSLLALDTAEIQYVFGIKKLTQAVLRQLPLDYLADTLRHSREVTRTISRTIAATHPVLAEWPSPRPAPWVPVPPKPTGT